MTIRIERLEEYGKTLAIAGFGGAEISDVPVFIAQAKERIGPHEFQVLNADHVAGWEHLYFAALNALKAFKQGRSFSSRLDIEMLLYASCQDQISRAFTLVGVTLQTSRIALMVLTETEDEAVKAVEAVEPLLGVRDDSVVEVDEAKFERLRKLFSVSEEELEAVTATSEKHCALTLLLIERCALLGLHR